MSGPLRAVLAAFEDGAGSLADVKVRTGLSRDVVTASVNHLVRLGRLRASQLAVGCPTGGGCGSCALASAGCSPRRGVVAYAAQS
ncbi:MAG: hypothetical protein ACLGHZ_02055 [Actinomycetes bacterium]